VGIVERYYGLIRRAYTIITAKIPGISKDIALQMAFKAINDTARPNRLVLTLLVYSAYPQITEYDPLLVSIAQRALAVKKAIAKVQKLRAKRQVNKGNTSQLGKWDKLYKLVSIDGESCVLRLPHSNTTFRATLVKLYLTLTTQIEVKPTNRPVNKPTILLVKRSKGRPRKNPEITVFLQNNKDTI